MAELDLTQQWRPSQLRLPWAWLRVPWPNHRARHRCQGCACHRRCPSVSRPPSPLNRAWPLRSMQFQFLAVHARARCTSCMQTHAAQSSPFRALRLQVCTDKPADALVLSCSSPQFKTSAGPTHQDVSGTRVVPAGTLHACTASIVRHTHMQSCATLRGRAAAA